MTDPTDVAAWLALVMSSPQGVEASLALVARRRARVAEFRDEVADASGLSIGEIIDRALADERREATLRITAEAAANTDDRQKRRLLALAAAKGLTDDAVVDLALMMARLVADLEPVDITVLCAVDESVHSGDEGQAKVIGELAGIDGAFVGIYVATLVSRGLVYSQESSLARPGGGWYVSGAGQWFLQELLAGEEIA